VKAYFSFARPSRQRRCISLLLLTLCVSVVAAAQQPDQGIVIGRTGKWIVDGKELNLADVVLAGKTATAAEPGKLTLWFEGRPPKPISCPPSCKENVQAPAKPSGSTSVVDRVASMFKTHEPTRYITAASRGLEPELKEAVVPVSNSRIDVSAAMADLPGDSYWVQLQPIDVTRNKPPAPQRVDWAPGKAASISSQNLKTGVYVLVLTDQDGEPAGSEAWILVSAPEDYPTALHAFQETVSAVAGWPREADSSVERAVLRASLEALAR
jgi:hypothetical protein